MRMPAAEIEITGELVAKLIKEQHPDLLGPLTMIANGWDNVIFRLGDDLLVRLPRRQLAAQLVINEQEWVPVIGPGLPVRTPIPVRVGRPTDDFGWSWTIGPWLPGTPMIELPVAERSRYAPQLAEFLAALHRPAPADAPHNPVRGVPLSERAALAAEHLDSGLVPDPDRLRPLWERLLQIPAWAADPVWVHGDPHPANLLVDHDQLVAVIDFGDVNAGDPATDLAAGWLSFDATGRAAFHDHYRRLTGMDDATWDRARGWALVIGMALLVNSDDHPQLAAVGRHALAAVAES